MSPEGALDLAAGVAHTPPPGGLAWGHLHLERKEGREGGREGGRKGGRKGGREEGEAERGQGKGGVIITETDRLTNEKVDVGVSAADGGNESCQEVHPLAVD